MRKRNLVLIACSMIAILLVTATGYPSETKEKELELLPPERFIEQYLRFEFPVRHEFTQLNARQRNDVTGLHQVINLYAQVYGSIPDSINTLVESNFLLYWPRNLMTGEPSEHVSAGELQANETDFASFRYERLDDSRYTLRFLSLDRDKYKDSKEKIWNERSMDYYASGLAQLNSLYITGGTKKIYEIDDFNTKLTVAKCHNFNRILISNGFLYTNGTGILPRSFEEILFNSTILIREGLQDFIDTIQAPGVNYKWGYDYDKKAFYVTLDIKGERYIAFNLKYVENDPRSGLTGFICGGPTGYMVELDMSTPLISSDDVSGLNISDRYLISASDISL